MAETQSAQTRQRKGITRGKKLSTKVDLTPMVDLGFLLITFFIFTTTLSEPKVMSLAMPADSPDSSLARDIETLNLILKDNNKIAYYNGSDIQHTVITDYSSSGLRNIIQRKLKEVALQSGDKGNTIILIKPTRQASYKNIVDVLDEMTVNGVKRYVLMDANEDEITYSAFL